MSRATRGSDLMQRLNDGRLIQVPSSEILKLRTAISTELEELLEVGARIRPLLCNKERIGWVRGVHPAERKILQRYFSDPIELAEQVVKIGTSLTEDYVRHLGSREMHGLLRVVTEMTNSDIRLYPYIVPFTTTSSSEQLWFSRGTELTRIGRREVELPEGTRMTLLSSPDQARLWAAACTYREKAKQRLEATANAVLIIRPWAGKSADGLANDLKNQSRALHTDVIEPWTEAIKVTKPIDLDDGWAHGEDSSQEGMMREIRGMLSNDKHEQVIAAFEAQQRRKATRAEQKAVERVEELGGPGFIDQHTEVLTATQARERVVEIQKGRSRRRAQFEEVGQNTLDKLKRYQ